MLAALLAILWWQYRYCWSANTSFGWPIPFMWDNGLGTLVPLTVNAAIWLALLGAVAYTLEHLVRKRKPFQITLGGLFVFQAVAATVFTLGCADAYLRAHPAIPSPLGGIWPQIGRCNCGMFDICFDFGLFTDPLSGRLPNEPPGVPPHAGPPIFLLLSRATIIVAIICATFGAICLSLSAVRQIGNSWKRGGATQAVGCVDDMSRPPQKDSWLVRILLWGLAVVVVLVALRTMIPPLVRE
jgi:hypothetical protein